MDVGREAGAIVGWRVGDPATRMQDRATTNPQLLRDALAVNAVKLELVVRDAGDPNIDAVAFGDGAVVARLEPGGEHGEDGA
jgi:hypothetical protein